MNKILAWIKMNPLTVAAVVVTVAALGVLGWVWYRGNQFVGDDLEPRAKLIGQVRQYMPSSVSVPSSDPNKPPEQIQIVINKPAVERMQGVFGNMGAELKQITDAMQARNQRGKGLILDGLFPEVPEGGVREEAKRQYRALVQSLLGKPTSTAPFGGLDAGAPSPADELARVLEQKKQDMLRAMTADRLTPEMQRSIQESLRKFYMDLLRQPATRIHIYAERNVDGPNFPLDIGAWTSPTRATPVTPEEIWEGQVSLWIYQDLVEAIARTNRVDSPAHNVLEAPIKRLVQAWVVPGYVGVNTTGGLFNRPASAGQASTPTPGFTPGVPMTPPSAGGVMDPAAAAQATFISTSSGVKGENVKVPDDFRFSPTGRVSNYLYDVKHVWVRMVVDIQKLPEFYKQLAQVNFMTPLLLEITQVDEFQSLSEGYFYGTGDCVQVNILIETIWFRDWTKAYMPRDIRRKLGIVEPAPPTGVVAPVH